MSKYLTKEQREAMSSELAFPNEIALYAHADEAERLLVECAAEIEKILRVVKHSDENGCARCAAKRIAAKLKAAGI